MTSVPPPFSPVIYSNLRYLNMPGCWENQRMCFTILHQQRRPRGNDGQLVHTVHSSLTTHWQSVAVHVANMASIGKYGRASQSDSIEWAWHTGMKCTVSTPISRGVFGWCCAGLWLTGAIPSSNAAYPCDMNINTLLHPPLCWRFLYLTVFSRGWYRKELDSYLSNENSTCLLEGYPYAIKTCSRLGLKQHLLITRQRCYAQYYRGVSSEQPRYFPCQPINTRNIGMRVRARQAQEFWSQVGILLTSFYLLHQPF